MILNDWSARDVQVNEMKLNLGPAKGKDFSTTIGPYLVTKDEISRPQNLSIWLKLNGKKCRREIPKLWCLI